MSGQAFTAPPGDPAGLRAAGGQFGRLAGEHAELRATFQRSVSRALERWYGGYADRFRGAAEEVSVRFDPVSESAKGAQQALESYASALEAAQRSVSAANAEAAKLAALHLSPLDRQQAMGQLDQQVSAAQSSVSRAAALCAATLAQAEATLAAACHDAVAVRQLRADVQRASAELKAADPAAWQRIFGPGGSLLRDVIEQIHTSLGAAGYDWWMWMGSKGAEAAEQWMRGLEEQSVQWLHELAPWGKGATADEWEQMYRLWSRRVDTAEAFGEDWVQQTKWLGMASRIGRVAGTPLAIWGDVYTMIDPPQAGWMGWADRGVAFVNAGVVATDGVIAGGQLLGVAAFAELSLGPVGAVVAVGTGLYLAGAYAYEHWAWFRNDVCKPIGHAVVDVVRGAVHALSSVASTVESWF